MTVTYPADPAKPYGDRVEAPRADMADEEPFVPVYARRGKARGGQGKIKTWMILTPVAVLALAGIGAMLVMQGDEESSTPLAEPAATAPVLPIAPTGAAISALTTASTPEPVVAAPVVRDAAPLRRITPAPAPARRNAVRTPTPAPAATPRVVTPAPVATGPQAYTPAPAAPSTATLNRAPATPAPATPAPAPTPPVIIVEPVG